MEKRKFQNNSICWEETAWDNKFYFSFNDGRIPTKDEVILVFCVLYRDVLLEDDGCDVDISSEYDEKHEHMVVTVKDRATQRMPKVLMRTKDHMPEPSFPMRAKVVNKQPQTAEA